MQENEVSVSNTEEDDEISLIDLFAVLLKYKKMIIGLTGFAMIAVVVFSIISLKLPPEKSPLPNVFTPQAKMLINDSQGTGATISSSMSSAASLFGLSIGGNTSKNTNLATYLASCDELLDDLSEEFGLVQKFEVKKSPKATVRKVLRENLIAQTEESSGVFVISYSDIDPEFACNMVNFTVDWLENKFNELGVDTNSIKKKNLEVNMESTYQSIVKLQKEAQEIGKNMNGTNNYVTVPAIALESKRLQMEIDAQQEVYKQLRTQYELLKIDMEAEQPVFQILSRPEIPDLKSGPSRGKLCIIVTFAAVFLSIFLAFLLNAIKNIKNDPEAMKKLKSVSSK